MEKNFLEKYGKMLKTNVARIDPKIWILASIAIAIGAGSLTYLIIFFKILDVSIVFPFVVAIAIADLLLGYPYILEIRRIEEIEGALPEILKQMADTLKSGGTYEYALREISQADYGPISKEVENVMRKLEEGENFENSMKTLSENIDSRLVQRTVTIIVDSLKAGAGLAEVLEEISEDVREIHHINIERKSRTMMGFMFIAVAGTIVAPAIFGLVSTIINYLITTVANAGIAGAIEIAKAIETKNTLILLMQFYIMIEIIATSIILALMREGKITKSLIYCPILLFLAYITMTVSTIASQLIVGGI